MPTRSILALDISTHVGWCVGTVDAPTDWGTVHLARRADEPDCYGPRYLRYTDWLADMITVHNPVAVVWEAPLAGSDFRGASAARQALGLVALTEQLAWRREVPVKAEVHNGTLKLWWAGSGRASKADMIARCINAGWPVEDDNQADAIALQRYAAVSPDVLRWVRRLAA